MADGLLAIAVANVGAPELVNGFIKNPSTDFVNQASRNQRFLKLP
jgi:hypothetical protein